jgi:hypothetical protein
MEESDDDSDDDQASLIQADAKVVRQVKRNPYFNKKNIVRARRSCCSCALLVGGVFSIIEGVRNHNVGLFSLGFFLLCCPCMLLCYTCMDVFCEYYGGACMERSFVIFATLQHHHSGNS